MKIYVAARFQDMSAASELANALRKAGHEITSSWLQESEDQNIDAIRQTPSLCGEYAVRDFAEIQDSEAFVVLSHWLQHRVGTGGKHVETGIAMALRIPVYVMGEPENIFHYHPKMVICRNVQELYKALKEQTRVRRK